MAAWWMYLVLGVTAGLVSASFGVGAGIVMVPALVLLFAMPQKWAQGTALAVMVPMALVGATRYVLNPEIRVDLRIALLVACGAVAGALVGAEIAHRLPAHVLRKAFAVFMFVVAIRMFFTKPRRPEPQTERPAPVAAADTAAATDQPGEGESSE